MHRKCVQEAAAKVAEELGGTAVVFLASCSAPGKVSMAVAASPAAVSAGAGVCPCRGARPTPPPPPPPPVAAHIFDAPELETEEQRYLRIAPACARLRFLKIRSAGCERRCPCGQAGGPAGKALRRRRRRSPQPGPGAHVAARPCSQLSAAAAMLTRNPCVALAERLRLLDALRHLLASVCARCHDCGNSEAAIAGRL